MAPATDANRAPPERFRVASDHHKEIVMVADVHLPGWRKRAASGGAPEQNQDVVELTDDSRKQRHRLSVNKAKSYGDLRVQAEAEVSPIPEEPSKEESDLLYAQLLAHVQTPQTAPPDFPGQFSDFSAARPRPQEPLNQYPSPLDPLTNKRQHMREPQSPTKSLSNRESFELRGEEQAWQNWHYLRKERGTPDTETQERFWRQNTGNSLKRNNSCESLRDRGASTPSKTTHGHGRIYPHTARQPATMVFEDFKRGAQAVKEAGVKVERRVSRIFSQHENAVVQGGRGGSTVGVAYDNLEVRPFGGEVPGPDRKMAQSDPSINLPSREPVRRPTPSMAQQTQTTNQPFGGPVQKYTPNMAQPAQPTAIAHLPNTGTGRASGLRRALGLDDFINAHEFVLPAPGTNIFPHQPLQHCESTSTHPPTVRHNSLSKPNNEHPSLSKAFANEPWSVKPSRIEPVPCGGPVQKPAANKILGYDDEGGPKGGHWPGGFRYAPEDAVSCKGCQERFPSCRELYVHTVQTRCEEKCMKDPNFKKAVRVKAQVVNEAKAEALKKQEAYEKQMELEGNPVIKARTLDEEVAYSRAGGYEAEEKAKAEKERLEKKQMGEEMAAKKVDAEKFAQELAKKPYSNEPYGGNLDFSDHIPYTGTHFDKKKDVPKDEPLPSGNSGIGSGEKRITRDAEGRVIAIDGKPITPPLRNIKSLEHCNTCNFRCLTGIRPCMSKAKWEEKAAKGQRMQPPMPPHYRADAPRVRSALPCRCCGGCVEPRGEEIIYEVDGEVGTKSEFIDFMPKAAKRLGLLRHQETPRARMNDNLIDQLLDYSLLDLQHSTTDNSLTSSNSSQFVSGGLNISGPTGFTPRAEKVQHKLNYFPESSNPSPAPSHAGTPPPIPSRPVLEDEDCEDAMSSITAEERARIIANNRSLRTIKTVRSPMSRGTLLSRRQELENLLENGAITDDDFDTMISTLPAEAPSHGRSGASRAPSAASNTAATAAMGNLATSHDAPPPSYNNSGPPSLPNRTPSVPAGPLEIAQATALYSYGLGSQSSDDCIFETGDRIAVHEHVNNDWSRGKNIRTGRVGLYPRNYVREVDAEKSNNGYGHPAQQQQYPQPVQSPYQSDVPPMAVAEQPSYAQSRRSSDR